LESVGIHASIISNGVYQCNSVPLIAPEIKSHKNGERQLVGNSIQSLTLESERDDRIAAKKRSVTDGHWLARQRERRWVMIMKWNFVQGSDGRKIRQRTMTFSAEITRDHLSQSPAEPHK
jgi:hypothetical protein